MSSAPKATPTPSSREVAYARVAADTPHLVLSTTLTGASWPTARIVRDIGAIRSLRQQPGNAVYVVGGPGLIASLVNATLLDELCLIVHPLLRDAERLSSTGSLSARHSTWCLPSPGDPTA